ncbi:hypothetical protein [uncultured Desulfovibrio sp.]|uniref:hypothetical protein n=1 Tax=uncultured Desulfovibrio sp. TaxID=167968 RepID=UPI002601D863|nr:hypothetical protein [uncultured Desulfovibrio sp.]
MRVLLQALLRLALGLLDFVRAERKKRRAGAVRADPAGEWLRGFGGADRRSGSGDAGGRGDG